MGKIIVRKTDVTDKETGRGSLFEQRMRNLAQVDILVSCAGVSCIGP